MKYAAIFLLMALAGTAEAGTVRMNDAELNEWMTYYYLHPKPEMTAAAIRSMHESGILGRKNAAAPVTSFLSYVFRKHPRRIRAWIASVADYPIHERQVIWNALWYADTKTARRHLKKMLKGLDRQERQRFSFLLKQKPPRIIAMEITSPAVLDMLWAAFMVTGEEKYVARIMSVLSHINIEGDSKKYLIGRAARWSLTSNAIQHKRVLDICRQQIDKQNAETSALLRQVIEKAEERRLKQGR